MKTILCLIPLLLWSSAPAQNVFQKTYGGASDDVGRAACMTTDGNLLIAGYTTSFQSSGSYEDFYLVKTDPAGNIIWTRSYGGSDMDMPREVCPAPGGGFVVAGGTRSFTIGIVDVAVIRGDAAGNIIWDKTFHVVGGETANAMAMTDDGGIIIAGEIYSGNYDFYVVRMDSLGNLLWSKTFGTGNQETAQSVRQTTDGGFIVCGTTLSFSGNVYAYVVKLDANGGVEWSNAYASGAQAYGQSVLETPDGGYMIAGYNDSLGTVSGLMIRIDSTGAVLWSKTYGGGGAEYVNDFAATGEGYVLTGSTTTFANGLYEDLYAIKTDTAGNVMWQKAYGGMDPDYGNAVLALPAGDLLFAGLTISFGQGLSDLYVVRTDANGYSGCNESSSMPLVAPGGVTAFAFGSSATPTSGDSDPAFAVSQGGQAAVLCSVTGIATEEAQSFRVFPNPFSETVCITGYGGQKIRLFDIAGRDVTTEFGWQIAGDKLVLDRNAVACGLYCLVLTDSEGFETTLRLVVQ